MASILVTGSTGLIGSAICKHFDSLGFRVFGIDNNQRKVFFGDGGDTSTVLQHLKQTMKFYNHIDFDIRSKTNMQGVVQWLKIHEELSLVVHAAAQPSHDLAAKIPYDDFETNANGTLHMLEACRQHCPQVPFVFLSTNKVYGDRPNYIKLKELESRWEFDDPAYIEGIDEQMSIDQCKHSLFGASKVAADVMVQEYGRYFNMPTCVLRGGCLTGPSHAGVQLHGFVNYFVRCAVSETPYTIFGYKGKQVRDNIHAEDVAKFVEAFQKNPRSAVVYNIGGGKKNSVSILELVDLVEQVSGKRLRYTYDEKAREGDHMCYYTNLAKIKQDYPDWDVTISLEETVEQIVKAVKGK